MIAVSKKTVLQVGIGVGVLAGAIATIFFFYPRASASAIQTPIPVVSKPAAVELPSPAPTAVPALPARAGTLVIAKTAGNLVSANQATLAFQTSGRIRQIQVKEGQRVQAGDVIATLDNTALDAQIVQAQANLDSAQANLVKVKAGPTEDDLLIAKFAIDRAKAAVDQAQAAYDKIGGASNPKISETAQSLALQQAYNAYQTALAQYDLTVKHPTDAELKAAQAAVAVAQAALETARQNAANARITAPFDGTVVWIGAKPGESAVSGTPEITLADLPHMQVQVNADQISSAAIQVGQAVSVTVDALPGKTLAGHVSKIGLLATSTGNLVSTLVTIDIDAANVPIYPGLSATVEFQGGAQ
ncbi:MAG: HlyD family secretion protein [Acidobacteriota bacterium]